MTGSGRWTRGGVARAVNLVLGALGLLIGVLSVAPAFAPLFDLADPSRAGELAADANRLWSGAIVTIALFTLSGLIFLRGLSRHADELRLRAWALWAILVVAYGWLQLTRLPTYGFGEVFLAAFFGAPVLLAVLFLVTRRARPPVPPALDLED